MTCAVTLTGVTKEYEKQIVVNDLSFGIKAGEVFGLLGPNGAGKTTVMKMISGLTRPTAGTIQVFGQDVATRSPAAKSLIGLVTQENNMERELTVEEALCVYGRLFKLDGLKRRVEAQLHEFCLQQIRHQRVGTLSGGTARRTLIARALLPGPKLLLLDEPTVGLDPDVRREVWQIIEQLAAMGKTIMLTTHYMEEADHLCRRVAILRKGRLAILDTPDGLKARLGVQNGADALEKAFIHMARERIE